MNGMLNVVDSSGNSNNLLSDDSDSLCCSWSSWSFFKVVNLVN